MKKSKKIMISLLFLVFLSSISIQTIVTANATSVGSKAGITLKKAEDPPISSTSDSKDPTQSHPTIETTPPRTAESQGGKGKVNLPKTGEIAGSGLLIVLGILLAWLSFRQIKRRQQKNGS